MIFFRFAIRAREFNQPFSDRLACPDTIDDRNKGSFIPLLFDHLREYLFCRDHRS